MIYHLGVTESWNSSQSHLIPFLWCVVYDILNIQMMSRVIPNQNKRGELFQQTPPPPSTRFSLCVDTSAALFFFSASHSWEL